MLNTPKPTQLNATIYKENLTAEEKETLYTLITKATAVPKPSAWKPKVGEEYWVVTGYGGTHKYFWTDVESDEAYYSMNNCFPTQELAETAVARLKIFAALQQYADANNSEIIDWRSVNQKWFFDFNYDAGCITFSYTVRNHKPGMVYFTDFETARDAVCEIGESLIKKYLFGIEEERDKTETDHA